MLYEMRLKDAQQAAFLKGEDQGSRRTMETVVMGMLDAGATYEFIAKATKLSIDEIKDIAAKHADQKSL